MNLKFLLVLIVGSVILQGCGGGSPNTASDKFSPQNLNQCLAVEAQQIGIVGGKLLGENHQLARSVANIITSLQVKGKESTYQESSCTASFLDQNILLTAAHCVSIVAFAKENKVPTWEVERKIIVLGTAQPFCGFSQKLENKTLEVAEAEKVLVKDEYEEMASYLNLSDIEKIKQSEHDLALIRISSNNTLAVRRPIKLAKTRSASDNNKHFLLGYGETLAYPSEGRPSDDLMPALRFTPMELISDDNFSEIYEELAQKGKVKSEKLLNEALTRSISGRSSFYSFTDPKKARGACVGDSGGPSIIFVNGIPLQTGVASVVSNFDLTDRDSCKTSSFYVNAHAHEDWLKKSFKSINSSGAVRSEDLFE